LEGDSVKKKEIAKAALSLAGDESSYVTGYNLSVNGGMRL
jgi:3-oxoacyl-[acyl-carrier protein] reductase